MKNATTIAIALVMVLGTAELHAQFDPTVTTSFGEYVAGEATTVTHSTVYNSVDEGPLTGSISFDRGSFEADTIEVGDVIGSVVFSTELPVLTPAGGVTLVATDMACSLEVSEVDTDLVCADAVVVSGDVGTFGVTIGAVVYSVGYANLVGGGAELELEDLAELTEPMDLGTDLTTDVILTDLFIHDPAGGTLEVASSIESNASSFADFVETFDLEVAQSSFLRGDVDGNGTVAGLLDSLRLLSWFFLSDPPPPCEDAADVDGNGTVSALLDALALLDWTFAAGDPPPDPGPDVCGVDPEGDSDGVLCETPSAGCD